jgi:hypothetical protein
MDYCSKSTVYRFFDRFLKLFCINYDFGPIGSQWDNPIRPMHILLHPIHSRE